MHAFYTFAIQTNRLQNHLKLVVEKKIARKKGQEEPVIGKNGWAKLFPWKIEFFIYKKPLNTFENFASFIRHPDRRQVSRGICIDEKMWCDISDDCKGFGGKCCNGFCCNDIYFNEIKNIECMNDDSCKVKIWDSSFNIISLVWLREVYYQWYFW